MKTLPKYTTIEIKEFPLEPDYSGDPLSELTEFTDAIIKREQDILTYRDDKIGGTCNPSDIPLRICIRDDNTGKRNFLRISRQYYAPDNNSRILISGDEESDLITVFFQKAINPISG